MSEQLFVCWPRLNQSDSENLFQRLEIGDYPSVDACLDSVEFSPVGQRVSQEQVNNLRQMVVETASDFGFNRRRGFEQDRPKEIEETFRKFDREMYWKFREYAPMTEAEAGSKGLWNWIALRLLPDVTHWRWVFAKTGTSWDRERWIGVDFTRHTWARQWWRAYRFQIHPGLIERLNEKELVQFLERKNTIAANPRLLCQLAIMYADARDRTGLPREALVTEVAKRVLRDQAFINPDFFDDARLEDWIGQHLEAAVHFLSLRHVNS